MPQNLCRAKSCDSFPAIASVAVTVVAAIRITSVPLADISPQDPVGGSQRASVAFSCIATTIARLAFVSGACVAHGIAECLARVGCAR